MLENFIFSHQKTAFEEALNNNEVSNEAIVFIGDTKEIWNHGTYFDGSTFDPSDLNNLIDNVKTSIDKLKIGKSFNLSASFNSTQAEELYNYLNLFKGHGGNITARFALNYNDIVFNEGILLSCRTLSRNNGVAVSGTNPYYYNLTIAYSTEDNYFKDDTSSSTGEVVNPDTGGVTIPGGGVIISPGVGGTVSPGGTSASLDNYKNYMMLAEIFITITVNSAMTPQGIITSYSYSGVEGVNTYPMYVITSGSGNKFLADNGLYKEIVVPNNVTYLLDLMSFNSNKFIELRQAVENKKLIQLDNPPFIVDAYDNIGQVVSVTSSSVILRFSVYNSVYQVGEKKNYNQGYIDLECKSDGIFTISDDYFNIERTGDGTKFLSDDGTYKEVSGVKVFTENSTPKEVLDYCYGIGDNGLSPIFYLDNISEGTTSNYISGYASVTGYNDDYVIIQVVGAIGNYGGTHPNQFIELKVTEQNFEVIDASGDVIKNSPYIWYETTSETIFNELKEAIIASRRIVNTLGSDLHLLYYDSNMLVLISGPTIAAPYVYNKICYVITETEVKNFSYGGSEIFYMSDGDTGTLSNILTTSSYKNFNTINKNITFSLAEVPQFYDEKLFVPEYRGEFSFGDTVYNITFPSEITWATYPSEFKANTTYQIEIINNIGKLWEVGKGEVAYKSDLLELNALVTTLNAYDTMKTLGTLNSNVIYVIKG